MKEAIKTAIENYVKENPGTSYIEIERLFDRAGFDYHGELVMCSDSHDNVIFWQGWNKEACELLSELIGEGRIHREPCSRLIYFIDGKVLTYPEIKRKNFSKCKQYWIPSWFKHRNIELAKNIDTPHK